MCFASTKDYIDHRIKLLTPEFLLPLLVYILEGSNLALLSLLVAVRLFAIIYISHSNLLVWLQIHLNFLFLLRHTLGRFRKFKKISQA